MRAARSATLALGAALSLACGAERVPVELAPPGGPDLSVALVYVSQSTQTQAFDVPLVADRDGLVRVWVAASGPPTAAPLVRVRVYDGATLVDTLALQPPGATIPGAVDEASLVSSWNAVVPGAVLRPGRSLLVDVDSDRKVVETDESNNAWPASGIPHPLDVVALPTLRLRVLSVRTADGRTGAASASNLDHFTSLLQRAWPVGALEATHGGTFTSSASAASDGAGWGTILSELAAKRSADGFTGYYYGAVGTSYGGGVAGLGYVPGWSAIGWDKMSADPDSSSSSEVLAHEIGHNFGLSHAPGCGASGADASYPYPGATLGAHGLDVRNLSPKAPTLHDLMAYCSDTWVSDYNYRKVLASLDARGLVAGADPDGGAVASEPEGLLVWGRTEGGVRVLEPAFHLPVAARPPVAGEERVTGLDAAGVPIFTVSFALAETACGGPAGAGFAFIVPLPAADAARLAVLRWDSPGAPPALRAQGPALPGLRAAAAPSLEPRGGGVARVRWDAAPAEVALVRDAETGDVLGFGRGGAVDVAPGGAGVEVRLPAGGAPRIHRLQSR